MPLLELHLKEAPVRPLCRSGRHRPHRSRARHTDAQFTTTICESCGCTLVRTESSPRWYYSGELG